MENELPKIDDLDFTNDVAILDWLCQYRKRGIESEHEKVHVLAVFASHEFRPKFKAGIDFDPENRGDVMQCIVEQSMRMLVQGSLQELIDLQVRLWKKKFLPPA